MAAPGAESYLTGEAGQKLISLITNAIALGLAPQLPGETDQQAGEASDPTPPTFDPPPARSTAP